MLSDIAIRRPVLAITINLILVVVGLAALSRLSVRELPDIDPPNISIAVTYPGASSPVVESQVTEPVEESVSGIAGITRITSWTRDEQASVRLEFALGHDLEAAANDVRDRVSRVVSSLPEGAGTPRIAKADSDANAMLYMSLSSPRRDNRALTDLAERFVVDRLSAVPGVASVSIGGDQRLAMRVWLDRQAMAARQITVADIEQALRRGNVELPAGRLESQAREFAVRTDVRLRGAEDFANLVIRDEGSTQLRLGDVAQVELGAYELRSETRINGATAIGLGVVRQSGANALAVSDGIQREVEEIRQTLPDDVIVRIGYDESVFVRSSINEVVRALLVALALVVAVIFIFLRSLRATLIPAVAIPVSIIATLPVLAALGFSINVLTLLALVLAIGLVVDDAIVVLENIHRRVEDGEAPLLGAQRGARQITFAVISTTLVLVAVFVPISFMQGATGRLFTEFGIAMAAAVVFSSFVALTLTPMMASRLLAAGGGGRADAGQRAFRGIARAYGRSVEFALGQPVIVIGIAVLISALAVSLFQNIDRDFAPSEDRGVFFVSINAPEGSSLDYTRRQVAAAEAILTPLVDRGDVESVYTLLAPSFSGPSQVNRAFIVLRLNDWGSGRASQQDLIAEVRPQLSALPGMRAFVFPPRTLGQRAPSDSLEMVLGGADTLTLQDWSERLIARIESDTGGITGLSTNWAEGKPEIRLRVDRRRAADLGVDLAEIGRTLEVMIGGRAITRFPDRGQEYDVLLQAAGVDRQRPSDLANIFVRSATTGQLVPLASVISLEEGSSTLWLRRTDGTPSITLSGPLAEGVSIAEGIEEARDLVREVLPPEAQLSFDGKARAFLDENRSILITFALAVLIVFLVLAGQFESFVHPLIIMLTVPLAVTGGLLGLTAFGVGLNVFSQIGMILLVGLMAKNGILMVEFANQLRASGASVRSAIRQAAEIRLRPIVMTTLSTMLGAVPLVLSGGAGSEGRAALAIVVLAGVGFATVLTLYVIPVLYNCLARFSKPANAVTERLARLELEHPAAGE